jgi:hypothetical protein
MSYRLRLVNDHDSLFANALRPIHARELGELSTRGEVQGEIRLDQQEFAFTTQCGGRY